MRALRCVALLLSVLLVSGCDGGLLSPGGDIAMRERNLILAATGLMLLIILPVITTTLVFAWRYRATNTESVYDPDWHHSTQLEVLIWTAPLLIIVALGAMTWMGTHLLDPFRPLAPDETKRAMPGVKPMVIDAIALDWKWLFIYPDQGIASVNDVAFPADMPVTFNITSATVMNSFFIPELAGQIYAMAGMETKLSLVANKPGEFKGLSSHYSGTGFSHMSFAVHGLAHEAFDQWVAQTKSKGGPLDRPTYEQLRKPSEEVPPIRYSSVDPGLYEAILNMCSTPGKMCQSEMMHIDAMGGGGKDSQANRARLLDDSAGGKQGNEAPAATFPASGRPANDSTIQPQGMRPRTVAPQVNGQAPSTQSNEHDDGHQAPGHSVAPMQMNGR